MDQDLPAGDPQDRLELDHVTVGYPGQTAVEDLTLHVPHGARVAVVGPNGAGKSTLFKALVGLVPLAQGRILIHGRALGHHKDCVAYVPQRTDIDPRFPLTVRDVVAMGRFGRLGPWRTTSAADRSVIDRSIHHLRLVELAGRPIGALSGGQQQRVLLARALAQEPHVLLMDEPFTGVDVLTKEVVLELLSELAKRDVTILVSTHDLPLAALHFDRVLLLNRRLVAYGPPSTAITEKALAEAFGGRVYVLPGGSVLVDECCPSDTQDGRRP